MRRRSPEGDPPADALVRRRQLTLQIDSTQVLIEAQSERARLAQLRFENGRSAYLEVLDAQRDLFEAEQALAGVDPELSVEERVREALRSAA